jgi:putative ABC transport system permease protein
MEGGKMFDLEKEIREWKKGFNKHESFEVALIADMELHLRDAFTSLQQEGLSDEEAFQRAVEQTGTAERIAAEYHKNRELALDRRTPWRPARFMPALAWNYTKVALRKLLRQKGYSFINIAGLAIGLASCILIYLWTQDAISYNRFHKNADMLYRVYFKVTMPNGSTEVVNEASFTPLARFVKAHCPEAKATARIAAENEIQININSKSYANNRIGFVDSDLLKMFSFEALKGNLEKALTDKFSCLLTEETARKFFGDSDPINKILTFNKTDIRVAGIIKAFPRQSDYHLDIIFPFGLFAGPTWQDTDGQENWGGNPLETYVQLRPGARPSDLEKSFNQAFSRTMASIFSPTKILFGLQPLVKKHIENPQGEGLIQLVPQFLIAAMFILLIACINFITLTTARSVNRAKEIGIRKVIGANRGNLIRQFFGESLLFIFIAMILALILTNVSLPFFGRLVGTTVSWNIPFNGSRLLMLAAIILLVSLVAGGYPALVISRFRPAAALKANPLAASRGGAFHKTLIVLQFSIAIFLIFFSIVVSRQFHFMNRKNLGFEKEHIISLGSRGAQTDSYEMFKSEIMLQPGIKNVTRAFENPAYVASSVMNGEWPGKNPDERITLNFMYVDFDFFETFRMQIVAGRSFSRDFISDPTEAYIINETAAKLMNLPDAVGKKLSIFKKAGTIIGVVKDFNFQPLHFSISPLVIGMNPELKKTNIFIRISPQDIPLTIRIMEKTWKKFYPELTWNYSFFSDFYANFYRSESSMKNVAGVSSSLAIIIACLGLFALASLSAVQRTKEIGIRKVLGAPTRKIMLLLTGGILKWVVLANLIALPIANHFSRMWMQCFAFRITLGWSIFAVSAILVLAIAFFTIGYQTFRAARANPVDSLRYE